jgi:predicted MPP superfamily phosphohydrolase
MPWFLRMLLYIAPLILIVQLYIGWRFQYAFRQLFPQRKKRIKGVTLGVIAFLNVFPVIMILSAITGHLRSLFIFQNHLQWQDFIFLFPYWWGLILAVEVFPYFLLLDAGSFVLSWKAIPRISFVPVLLNYLKLFLVVFFAFYVGFRIYSDTYHIHVVDYTIRLEKLPQSLTNLKLTLLGDIQVDRYTQNTKLDDLRKKLQQHPSDILFFSGDLVTNGSFYISQGMETICAMSAREGKFACMGDHDYWADGKRISKGMKKCGWTFLQNAHHLVNIKGNSVLITGVTQIYSRKISAGDLNQLLSEAPAADLKILLVHQPSPFIIESAKKHGYNLVLAGHTHGGQIQFKPLGFTFTPSMLETPYFSGIYNMGNVYVAVTNGIGLTFAPVRYQAPAEITTLTLRSR